MRVAHEPKVPGVLDQAGLAPHRTGQGVAQLHVQVELALAQPAALEKLEFMTLSFVGHIYYELEQNATGRRGKGEFMEHK